MKKRIIIVDDRQTVLDTLKDVLEYFECEVISVLDPNDTSFVKEYTQSSKVDMIITDFDMSNIDGLAVIKEALKYEIPTTLHTGGPGNSNADNYYRAIEKARYLLMKPFDMSKLYKTLDVL